MTNKWKGAIAVVMPIVCSGLAYAVAGPTQIVSSTGFLHSFCVWLQATLTFALAWVLRPTDQTEVAAYLQQMSDTGRWRLLHPEAVALPPKDPPKAA